MVRLIQGATDPPLLLFELSQITYTTPCNHPLGTGCAQFLTDLSQTIKGLSNTIRMNRKLIILLALLGVFGIGSAVAQTASQLPDHAMANLKAEYADLGLTDTDVAELRVSDAYTSQGVDHIYLQQYYRGVAVHNGIAGFAYKGDKLVYRHSNLSTGFAEQQPAFVPAIPVADAVKTAARPLDVTTSDSPQVDANTDGTYTFIWDEVSSEPLTARLVFLDQKGELALCWQVFIDQVNTPDNWLIHVDALTGQPLERINMTRYDNHSRVEYLGQKNSHTNCQEVCLDNDVAEANTALPLHEALLEASLTDDGSVYNVFPFGIEAPIYGERELISEPASLSASPFGWHDTNGIPGPEFTFTRGNNVWAYPDRDNNNAASGDDVIDGGDSLRFDFFYEDFGDLDSILPAAVTQLFYTNNMIHDFAWHHGFDESSGNFQQNNYGNGGQGSDPIRAEAQDGGGLNNANFFTPPDGSSGRMQMYVWENGANSDIRIDEPAGLSGTITVGNAQFGPQELTEDITAPIVVAVDGSSMPELVCESVVNGPAVNGNVALIRRGECFFEEKVLNAEAAGAVAVIICNPENTLLNMAGGVDDDEPTIPSVLIEEFRCAEIRQAINNGDDVVVTFPVSEVPPPIDGDFDNGIVAHEYAHGVSIRLVGGPSAVSCLNNTEQMGEGWSDFFSLAISPINGSATMPTGAEPRGIGNFAINAGVNGGGIRRQPYSTDMDVNDFTYDDIITSGIPHPLGEIWNTTLWDLYWRLVDEYGFDEDLVEGNGGNNIAVKLVIEGMKNTPCSPGMVDGRNGILAADFLLYDGANQCLIWEVFSRRGLGFNTDQGSPLSNIDGVESFDNDPACIPTVKVAKETDEVLIDAGEGFRVTLNVRNDKAEAVTEVLVTDELPEGLTVVDGSVIGTSNFEIQPGSITFTLAGIDPGEENTIRYDVTTSTELHSVPSYFDGAEAGDEEWSIFPLNGEGFDLWQQGENDPFEGDFVWFISNSVEANDQILTPFEPFQLVGERPGIRFYTQYNTEAKWDAGLVEMSMDGINWTNVGNDRILRGKYRGEVAPSAFDASVSDLNSYWGVSDGYREVLIDFSDMAGQEVFLRWRFGSDAAETAPEGTPGWWVDNIEVMDVFRYNGMVSVTTAQGDEATAFGQDGGVLIQSMEIDVAVDDPALGLTEVSVFPNPANDFLQVRLGSQRSGQADVQLMSIEGRVLSQQSLDLVGGGTATARFATGQLPAGVYLVQVRGAQRVHTEKVTIQ